MKRKKISVIIPTYNRATYIEESIRSILGQNYGNYDLEVIVVDDGSTDNTERIIRSIKGIEYIKIKHSGLPSVARNYGIKKSGGDLIAFQDSDDLWTKDKLSSQINAFKDPEIILSYGNAEFIDQDGRKKGKKILAKGDGKSGFVFKELVNNNFISTLTVMARREALEKCGFFNESGELFAVEDYHLWLRMSKLGKFKYIDKTLAYYRIHDQNISASKQIVSIKRLIGLFILLGKDLSDERRTINLRIEKLYRDCSNLSTSKALKVWYKFLSVRSRTFS